MRTFLKHFTQNDNIKKKKTTTASRGEKCLLDLIVFVYTFTTHIYLHGVA